MWKKIQKWWYFRIQNPVVRKGEKGAFKWCFRRFLLKIGTLSGNFEAVFTAGEHPYGYLLAGKEDDNIEGYCQMLYTVAMLLTTDQTFVNDIRKAVEGYEKRQAGIVEDPEADAAALASVREVQEHVEKPQKERRKIERGIDGRFRKAVKDVQEGSESDV